MEIEGCKGVDGGCQCPSGPQGLIGPGWPPIMINGETWEEYAKRNAPYGADHNAHIWWLEYEVTRLRGLIKAYMGL